MLIWIGMHDSDNHMRIKGRKLQLKWANENAAIKPWPPKEQKSKIISFTYFTHICKILVERAAAFMQKLCRLEAQHSIGIAGYIIQHTWAVPPVAHEGVCCTTKWSHYLFIVSQHGMVSHCIYLDKTVHIQQNFQKHL